MFGVCLLINQSPYNLVSWSQLRRNGFLIRLRSNNNGEDMFEVSKEGVCYLLFKQNNEGMFLCSIRKVILNDAPFWIGDGLKYNSHNSEVSNQNATALAKGVETSNISEAELMRIRKAKQIHRSLSHCSDKIMIKMIEGGLIKDILVSDVKRMRDHLGPCQVCLRAKMTNIKKKNTNKTHTNIIGEVLHIDLMFLGKSVFLVCVDEATGFLISLPIKDRSKEMLLISIKRIITYLNGFGKKTKRVCCDRESGITAVTQELSSMGIELYRSSTEGHDARIERQIRTLKSKIRATAMDMPFPLPREWIDHLVHYVTQAQNLVPNNKTGLNSPFFLMCGERNIEWVNQFSFGDVVLMKVPYADKLQALKGRSEYGVVIGRDLISNHVFTLYRIESKSIVYRNIMKKVNFSQVPEGIKLTLSNMKKDLHSQSWIDGTSPEDPVKEPNKEQNSESNEELDENRDEETKTGGETEDLEEKHDYLSAKHHLGETNASPHQADQEKSFSKEENKENQSNAMDSIKVKEEQLLSVEEYNGPSLQSKEGTENTRFITNIKRKDELMNGNVLCVNERKLKKENWIDENEKVLLIEARQREIESAIVLITVNKAIESFGTDPVRLALMKEIKQLVDTGTFMFINKNEALNSILIPTTVVVAEKNDSSIKGRIVAMGNHQDRSLYKRKDVSSPAVRTETLFLVIAITASKHSRLYSFDIAGAYLHSNLPEERSIAIRFTREVSELMNEMYENVERDIQGFCYGLLRKGLYGLIEAGNLWNKLLSSALNTAGYQASSYDPCLFWKKREKPAASISDLACYLIVIHVDDLLISSPEEEEITRIRGILEPMFGKMKFHDENSFEYRGITIHQDENEIRLEQKKKVKELIKDVLGDVDERLIKKRYTPSSLSLNNKSKNDELMNDVRLEGGEVRFRTCVAKAQWLATQCRPDIRYVTSWLASRVEEPRHRDMKALTHLAQYLFWTRDYCIKMKKGSLPLLTGQSDASWLTHADLSGQSGGIVYLGGSYVLSISKRQHKIARSSTESEILAAELVCVEIEWLRMIMKEIGCEQATATEIFVDNHSMITMLEDGVITSKSKHINWRIMRSHQLIKENVIKLQYKNTNELDADILTKAVDKGTYIKAVMNLMNLKKDDVGEVGC